MLATRFTELVGCSMPIQHAGMGPLANPRLPAVVAVAACAWCWRKRRVGRVAEGTARHVNGTKTPLSALDGKGGDILYC